MVSGLVVKLAFCSTIVHGQVFTDADGVTYGTEKAKMDPKCEELDKEKPEKFTVKKAMEGMCCTECSPQCTLWADPHISSFDNVEGEQGPEYLSLASNQGAWKEGTAHTHHQKFFTTHFQSFDNYHSKMERRWPGRKSVATTIAPAKNVNNETTADRTLDANAYEAGDFWLVRSPTVHIQGRFRLAQEFLPDNAAIGGVAVGGPFLGGHVIMIEPLDGDATLDGAPMPAGSFTQVCEAGNMTMEFFPGNAMDKVQPYADFTAQLPLGVKLRVRRWLRHLDLKIQTDEGIPGGTDGECGNMNGDAHDDSSEGISGRMGDVHVNESMKLFTKKFPVWVATGKSGFSAVQATGDAHLMAKFIRLELSGRGAQLMSESKLSGILPYYTGEAERNSYSDLLSELREADWVKGFDTASSWTFGSIIDRIFAGTFG